MRTLLAAALILGLAIDRVSADDPTKALELNNQGYLFHHGLGGPADLQVAEGLYRRAVEYGSSIAMFNLAALLSKGGKDVEAAFWMFEALKAGDPFAFSQMTSEHRKWPRSFKRELQLILLSEGLLHGEANGHFDRRSISAIERTKSYR